MGPAFVVLPLTLTLSVPAAADDELAVVRWERLLDDGSSSMQYVGARRRGEVEIYRAEPPAILRIGEDGSVRSSRPGPEQLHAEPLMAAALDERGDTWLLRVGASHLMLVDTRGRAETLPATGWSAAVNRSVGFMRGDPVTPVLPFQTRRGTVSNHSGDPPLILRYDGRRWEPLLSEAIDESLLRDRDMNEILFHRGVHLAGASHGRLWVANENLYRIRQLSPSGRVLLDIDLGPDVLPPRKEAEEVLQASEELLERAKRRGYDHRGARAGVPHFKPVIAALVEGPDRRLYLLSHPGALGPGRVLDRFDPMTMKLERLATNVDPPGPVSMAAGRDGLHAAALRASRGHWRVSWEALDAAPWTLVEAFDPVVAGDPD